MTAIEDRPATTSPAYEQGRADAAALGLVMPEPTVPAWIDQALAEWIQEPTVYVDGDLDPFATECPAWCEYAPHTFTNCAEDRDHSSYTCSVPLELETAHQSNRGEGTLAYESETAVAYLKQGYRDIEPHIFIGKGELAGMCLTLDEVARFVELLQALVTVAVAEREAFR